MRPPSMMRFLSLVPRGIRLGSAAMAHTPMRSVSSGSPALDETSPRMPHLELSEEEMDTLHPSLLAPTDELLQDLVCDKSDQVCQLGLRLAKELQEGTDETGRRRHAAEGCSGKAVTTATAETAKQASSASAARRHSRRRSAKVRPTSPFICPA